MLRLRWSPPRLDDPPASGRTIQQLQTLLPAVLHRAPLRCLHLSLSYSHTDLHLFCAFTQLRLLVVQHTADSSTMAATYLYRPFLLTRSRPWLSRPAVGLHAYHWSDRGKYSQNVMRMEEKHDDDEAESSLSMTVNEVAYAGTMSKADCVALSFEDEGKTAAFFAAANTAKDTAATEAAAVAAATTAPAATATPAAKRKTLG